MESSVYLSISRVWVSLKTPNDDYLIFCFWAAPQLLFFVAKGRFNLKSTLSSFQALEGDAQTSGNTARSTCTVTRAQSVVQHPSAGPQGLLHLHRLWKKLKGKSGSFFPPEAEDASLRGVGSTAGGTLATVRGSLPTWVCKKPRGCGRACPAPGWWPLGSSAGFSCSKGHPGLSAGPCCAGRSPSSQGRAQPRNGVRLALYLEKLSFWDRVRAPGGPGWYISGTYGFCMESVMLTPSAGLWSRLKCRA